MRVLIASVASLACHVRATLYTELGRQWGAGFVMAASVRGLDFGGEGCILERRNATLEQEMKVVSRIEDDY